MPLSKHEETVLILAPVGNDAPAMAELLAAQDIVTRICKEPGECTNCIASGVGALLMTEEALKLPEISALLDTLNAQPEWSELPLIILTSGGETRMAALLDLAASAAGTVTLLERPMRAATLWRSVQVALRSRRRQYQVRDLIETVSRHAATLEKAVEERTAELRATNEGLETLVYSIAHDLRAPLRAMSGYSQVLMTEHAADLAPQGRLLVERIQKSSQFMDRLLQDLLTYGRTARAELALGQVESQRAWDSALFQCASQIEQTGAQIETVMPLPQVCAHEPTLGQILANLLSNSLKFVAPGVRPRVRFRAEVVNDASHASADSSSNKPSIHQSNSGFSSTPHAQGSTLSLGRTDSVQPSTPLVRLWVEDNGIGIAPQHHDRVFRVFERLNGAQYPGTGIGLSIVRKAVERMGGDVGLESAPGQGTRVWIELPKAV